MQLYGENKILHRPTIFHPLHPPLISTASTSTSTSKSPPPNPPPKTRNTYTSHVFGQVVCAIAFACLLCFYVGSLILGRRVTLVQLMMNFRR